MEKKKKKQNPVRLSLPKMSESKGKTEVDQNKKNKMALHLRGCLLVGIFCKASLSST